MKIDLTFAHLHTPLFFDSKNWGEKLDVRNTTKGKIELTYDQAEKELIVTSGGKMAIIPTSNVVSMTPMPTGLAAQAQHLSTAIINPTVNPPLKGKRTAQASTPMDHVQKGLGAGRTND